MVIRKAVDDFVKKYGVLHQDTKDALERIDNASIPVDIRPIYPLAESKKKKTKKKCIIKLISKDF